MKILESHVHNRGDFEYDWEIITLTQKCSRKYYHSKYRNGKPKSFLTHHICNADLQIKIKELTEK